MSTECIIMKRAKSPEGAVVLLDFSQETTPKVGMLLKEKSHGDLWRIKGMSMPILTEMLAEKILSPYMSKAFWNCLLEPVQHKNELKERDILQVV